MLWAVLYTLAPLGTLPPFLFMIYEGLGSNLCIFGHKVRVTFAFQGVELGIHLHVWFILGFRVEVSHKKRSTTIPNRWVLHVCAQRGLQTMLG